MSIVALGNAETRLLLRRRYRRRDLPDAFLIRLPDRPAVMQLLGEHAWWMPRWLARRPTRIALAPADVRA